MLVFMSVKEYKSCPGIGDVFNELLQKVARQVEWPFFKQFYAMLIMFLQYISDKLKSTNILKDVSIDTLCFYINEFIC